MGQGYSLTTPSAGSAGIDVPELADLVYEKSLGSARFMKSIRARHPRDGVVLVKILVKPYTPMALGAYRDRLLWERRRLADVPNVLVAQRVVETDTNGYLVRQFLYNSLYDRLSTRPFLEDIEKKWLVFQLLCALRDCHAHDVYHGDIKTENVLVTSWNWLYLTDFSAAFKPVLLPDDNPADFSYFFDTSGRRTCYLAPERFVPSAVAAAAAAAAATEDARGGAGTATAVAAAVAAAAAAAMDSDSDDDDDDDVDIDVGPDGSGGEDDDDRAAKGANDARPRRAARPDKPGNPPPNRVTWAMDVFSAGCVIAELILEAPIFNLSQLFRYRRGEYDPAISHLSRIPDRDLADMIAHMIQLDPQKRYSAEEYLTFYRGKVFPDYFYSFLHQYMELITDPSPGAGGSASQDPAMASGAARNLGEADERIDRVYYDFDKIAYFLGFQDPAPGDGDGPPGVRVARTPPSPPPPKLGLGLFPVHLNIPTKEHDVRAGAQPTADNGALIFLTLIVASIRNTARAASKIRACDVLLAFAERLTDEAKLDRVLPYLMALLRDRADLVVVAAVRSITQLLALVRTVSPVNAHVFLEYILPRMQATLLGGSSAAGVGVGGGSGAEGREASPLVRATYAACLGSLATTANRFLEMAARVDRLVGAHDDADLEAGSTPAAGAGGGGSGGANDASGADADADADAVEFEALFDVAQRDLVELFEQHTQALIEDPDPYVRRAFLTSVPELCLFFGPADANDIIVTHLNTYLNDRDWMVKCAFFDATVGVATFLGSVSLEEFFLPLMVQALTEPEEHVVQAVLAAMAELADVGLFSKQVIWDLVAVVARFGVHPNVWIREAAAHFLAAATKYLSPAQVRCMFMPLVMPYLKPGMSALQCAELDFLDHLQKPLSRAVFDQAVLWAMKTKPGQSLFWRPVQNLRGFPFSAATAASSSLPPSSSAAAASSSSSSAPALAGADRDAAGAVRALSKVARSEEDEQWIGRLRNLGLAADDEFKLLALRELIWRLSRPKLHEEEMAAASAAAAAAASAAAGSAGGGTNPAMHDGYLGRTNNHHYYNGTTSGGPQQSAGSAAAAPNFNNIVSLRSLGITIQNIIFDEVPQRQTAAAAAAMTAARSPTPALPAVAAALGAEPRTIEDALQDASMTIDDPIAKRRRAALNSFHRAQRVGSRSNGSSAATSPAPALRDGYLTPGASAATSPSTGTPPAAADGDASPSRLADGGRRSSSSSSSVGSKQAGTLRHRPSAIHLLNHHRKDNNVKSVAETATTETNAFGHVEGRSALTGGGGAGPPWRSPAGPSSERDSTTTSDAGGTGAFGLAPRSSGVGGGGVAGGTGGGGGGGGGDGPTRFRAHHNYGGTDPNVLQMLNAMYVENYPHDLAEFSPMVTPISRKRATAAAVGPMGSGGSGSGGQHGETGSGGGSGSGSSGGWRPSGQMVATFSEHTGAINRVVVAPDHAFFLTGGDDGTVRVWDTQRLERNISNRSRQVHRHTGPGARVLALCFIENTHCFVSCASDGSVHVVKVDYMAAGGNGSGGSGSGSGSGSTMPRYGRLRLLREYQLPRDSSDNDDNAGGEWAVWCEHYKQESSSVLVLATNQSRVLGIDLRTMTLLFVLRNPVHHGAPTCFAVDRKHNWLVVATSHGVLDLWDLRFHMRLKAWGVAGGAPIYRLAIHPSRGRGRWLCVAGGTGHGEVTVWDLEKTLCREVYRVGGSSSGGSGGSGGTAAPSKALYEPWDVDADRPEGMLGRFATSLDPGLVANGEANAERLAGSGGGGGVGGGDKGVRAMAVGAVSVDQQRDVRHAFLVTGGSDKKLRFWDLARIEHSTVYSGPVADEGGGTRPTLFTATQVTAALTVHTERVPRPPSSAGATSAAAGSDGKPGSRRGTASASGGSSGGGGSGTSPRPSRSSVVAMQQQQLLRSHLDAILDVALLESPYMATVSVDRMGVIFVFS